MNRESLFQVALNSMIRSSEAPTLVQGALAADAQYERYALYLNDQYESASGWVFEPGIRFSSVGRTRPLLPQEQ